MRLVLAALALVCAALPAWAQPPVPATPPAAPPPGSVIGRVLTLEEAIAISLESQPLILARLKDYEAARYRVDQAFAPLLPNVLGSWTVARAQSATVGGIGFRSNDVTHSWNTSNVGRLSASQLLFDFGKSYATVESTRKGADIALEDVELQRQLLTQAVKESYTNLLFAQRLIRVNRQAVERADLNLRSARGFFDVGTRPKSDVTRAEVDVANARLDVIRAQNAERLARAALNTAMGLSADTPTQIVDNLAYEPVRLDRAQLQAEALRQRPEYKQVRLRADAAEFDVRRRYLDFLPDLTGGASYGFATTHFGDIWELNLNLTWSIFDGGNRIARHREARALLEGTRARIRSLELDIGREVEQAFVTVEETQERIVAAQKAVESAQENFRLAQGRFDAGVGTILELTDAQLALTLAQNQEAQALADYRIALARVDRAVGRR